MTPNWVEDIGGAECYGLYQALMHTLPDKSIYWVDCMPVRIAIRKGKNVAVASRSCQGLGAGLNRKRHTRPGLKRNYSALRTTERNLTACLATSDDSKPAAGLKRREVRRVKETQIC